MDSEEKTICIHQGPGVLSLLRADTEIHVYVCKNCTDLAKQRGKQMLNEEPFLGNSYWKSFKELINSSIPVL